MLSLAHDNPVDIMPYQGSWYLANLPSLDILKTIRSLREKHRAAAFSTYRSMPSAGHLIFQ